MGNKKVLLLTASYGDGHIKVANSLLKQFKDINNEIDVKMVDIFNEAHPMINNIIRYIYLKSYSVTPRLYNFFYYSTRNPAWNLGVNRLNILFAKRKLIDYIKEYNPDLVINTYSVLAMPKICKDGISDIPCYTIVTDYGVHSQWIHEGTYKYFVGHSNLINDMKLWGVDESRIYDYGIPVYIEYPKDLTKEKVIEKYGLMDHKLPIITILGGANGVLKNLNKITKILKTIENAQFIIVCGKNVKVKEELEKRVDAYKGRVIVTGFVDNLYEIINISDIVITKPGGITITELINLDVPFVLYGIPSGQERENTKFLLNNKCSILSKNIKELCANLSYLLENPELIENFKTNLNKISKKNACEDIVKTILNDIK